MTAPAIAEIKAAAAAHFDVRILDLESARKTRSVARPRQVAMYLCRQLTRCSFPQIASAFGKRDHTTALHASRAIAALRRTDPEIDAAVLDIMAELAAGDVCTNCDGTGLIHHCGDPTACADPDGGCDLCMESCDWCGVKIGRQ